MKRVTREKAKVDRIPVDIPGVELTHHEVDDKEYMSFDAIMRKYGLKDPALEEMAKNVRGADADIPDPPKESAGLDAAGFRALAKDDFENMKLQFQFYDAFYEYCRWRVEESGKLRHSAQ
jgi:hypothetical protein